MVSSPDLKMLGQGTNVSPEVLQRAMGHGHAENGDKIADRLVVSHATGRVGTTLEASDPAEQASGLGVPATWDAPAWSCPRLRVLHGPETGRSFLLRGRPSDPDRGWVVGRGEGADVSLDRDLHVEHQAVDIDRSDDGFELVDLRTAEGRVSLNGAELDRGERRQMEDQDLIGVGASLLLLRV